MLDGTTCQKHHCHTNFGFFIVITFVVTIWSVCSGQGEGLSLEEQKSKLAKAKAKAEGALAKGDHGEAGCWLGQGAAGVRGVALGCDRDGMHYWKLQAAEAFGGD